MKLKSNEGTKLPTLLNIMHIQLSFKMIANRLYKMQLPDSEQKLLLLLCHHLLRSKYLSVTLISHVGAEDIEKNLEQHLK